MKALTEAAIQKTCLQWLRFWGAVAIRVNSGARVIPETKTTKRRYLKSNDQPGCSDVLVCLPDGAFAALEVKKPGEDPTPDQQAFLDKVTKAGGLALVVHSLDELKQLLQLEGYDVKGTA